MPLIIVRNDITTMRVDAIVNAANESLLGGGGVDGCIHRAAGPELLAECRRLGGCRTGEAKLTRGYRLPCKYIIHTVGPVWHGGDHGEQEQLVSCYRTSLALARKHHCQTVAFPLISSGVYGYPKEQALRTAMDAIGAFLLEHDMTVYLVIFDRSAYQISSRLFADIAAYIDDHYVDAHTDFIRSRPYSDSITDEDVRPTCRAPSAAFPSVPRPLRSLNDRLRHLDAGFSETLLTRIDRSGKKDSEIYKRANVDRKLFSKIRSNPDYRPSKPTALAFAIALELDLNETRDLIARAGYALSRSLNDRLRHLDAGFSETLLTRIDRSGKKDSEIYKRANVDRKLFSKIRSNPDYRPSKPTALAFAIALELDLNETRDLIARAGYALSRSSKFDVIIEYFISQRNYNIYEINEALFAFDQSLLGA